MASQFVIRENPRGSFDVFVRDLVSHGEYRQRFEHLTRDCGFSPEVAAEELYHMVGRFIKSNEDDAELPMCVDFVFSHLDPGDFVVDRGVWFVVNRPASA
jgi:hypothetical protein